MGYAQTEVDTVGRFLKNFEERSLANADHNNKPLLDSLILLLNTALERDRIFAGISFRQRRELGQLVEHFEIPEGEPKPPLPISYFLNTRHLLPLTLADTVFFKEDTVFKTDRESWAKQLPAPGFEGIGSKGGMRIVAGGNLVAGNLYEYFVLPETKITMVVFASDGSIQTLDGGGKRDLSDPQGWELETRFATITPQVRERVDWIKHQLQRLNR